MISLLLLLAMAAAVVDCKGEIKIKNQPKGLMWCNTSFVLEFSYGADKVPAGKELKIQLMSDRFNVQLGGNVGVLGNVEIVELGSVVAPATKFNITLPTPFPEAWTGSKKLDNDGHPAEVLFRVKRADNDDINSDCSSPFCVDASFDMTCCEPSKATVCGCKGCSCANNDVCTDELVCDYTTDKGVCQERTPSLGEPCPAGKCLAPYACRCPDAVGLQCLASQKTCVDNTCAKPALGVAGRFNCPCSPAPENLCQSGTVCSQYFCRISPTATIDQLSCTPAVSVAAKDECMLHKDGSTSGKTYSCQNNKCTRCVPGDTLCVCTSSMCARSDNVCEGGRCFLRTGCEGCACTQPDLSCKVPGTICISGTCTRIITAPVAPTETATPAPTTSKANLDDNDAARRVLATIAAVAALVVQQTL